MTGQITLAQAVPLLGHKIETLRAWAGSGKLKAMKIGEKWFTTGEWVNEFIAQSNKPRPHVAAWIREEGYAQVDQALRALGLVVPERSKGVEHAGPVPSTK